MTKEKENLKEPDIFSYDDYRKYLGDAYQFKKFVEGGFSFRTFAKKAGIASSGYYKLIMDGKRNLSREGIIKFSKGLDLNSRQAKFFETLVHFDQSESPAEKTAYFDKIQENRRFRSFKQLETDQYQFYKKWYYSAVRELVSHPNFKEDPKWIAKTLMPEITPEEAKDAMELLDRLKLIQRTRTGKVVQSEELITSAPQVYSSALWHFHNQMLYQAFKSLSQFTGEHRDFTSITLSLRHSDMEEISKKITTFRRKLLSEYDVKKTHFDRVFQMNFSLFPLTHEIDKKK